MSESYVECMVARKTPAIYQFLKYLLIMLCAVVAIASFLYGNIVMFIIAIALGVGAYFVITYTDIEYEYLYLDKEITVDKVMHKAKRKRVATYEIEKMEIMAPFHSYQLDSYKNRTAKVVDYSSRVENQPDTRYVFFYNGSDKIIFEPNMEMVRAIKNVAPRKVFMD